jgi:hypothetical protein
MRARRARSLEVVRNGRLARAGLRHGVFSAGVYRRLGTTPTEDSLAGGLGVGSTNRRIGVPARAWVVAGLALIALQCGPEVNELPEVKTAMWNQACSVSAHGVPVTGVTPLNNPDIATCVPLAWATRCEGAISFEAEVDRWGNITELGFDGEDSPRLRACIKAVLSDAVLLPAKDCRDVPVKAVLRGGISWPKNEGTAVRFGGQAGIIACIRDCSLGRSASGPTNGCS